MAGNANLVTIAIANSLAQHPEVQMIAIPHSGRKTDSFRFQPLIQLVCLLLLASFWQPVFAQSEEDTEGMLEEVTVTAQRRAESLQSVPISVTVFDAEELREAGVRILSDISTRTPGFAMGTFNTSGV